MFLNYCCRSLDQFIPAFQEIVWHKNIIARVRNYGIKKSEDKTIGNDNSITMFRVIKTKRV